MVLLPVFVLITVLALGLEAAFSLVKSARVWTGRRLAAGEGRGHHAGNDREHGADDGWRRCAWPTWICDNWNDKIFVCGGSRDR